MKRTFIRAVSSLLWILILLVAPSYSLGKSVFGAGTGPSFAEGLAMSGGFNWTWLFPFAAGASYQPVKVLPGGQSIGIKLHASGILVVGYHFVHSGRNAVSPAEKRDIRIGDVIVGIDGRRVTNIEEVSRKIEAAGLHHRELSLTCRRKGELARIRVQPLLDDLSGSYQIGLYIRDSASGVGTLTFYVPENHVFGALGHVIADVDTGEPIDGQGQIVHAAVTSIDRGESGQPGEKRSLFVNDQRVLGIISRNTDFGVFGRMPSPPDHSSFKYAIPVARVDEVHPGPARILTVVEGQKVESFSVLIIRASHQEAADVKGLIIRVTDPALLTKTGGIVQGMSGSPILQDGKLVGAVTHVFVSDPTQGYGVYAEWMLSMAGVDRPAVTEKIAVGL